MTVQNPSLPGSGIAVRVLRDDGKTYIGAVVPVELYTAGFAANAIRNSAGISATEIARLGMIQATKSYTPARPPIIEGPGWAVFHGSMVTAAIARDDGVSYFSYTVDPGNYNASSVSSVLAAIPGLTASELARAKGIGGGVISGGTSGLPTDGIYLSSGLGSPTLVYASKRVISGYSGPIIQVAKLSAQTTVMDAPAATGTDVPDYSALDTFAAGDGLVVVGPYDQSGNANHSSQATTTKRPSFKTGQRYRGIAPILIDGVSRGTTSLKSLPIPSSVSVNRQNFTLLMVVRPAVSYEQQAYVEGTGNGYSLYTPGQKAYATSAVLSARDGTAAKVATGRKIPKAQPTIIGMSSTSAGAVIHNGTETTNVAAFASGSVAGGLIGESSAGATYNGMFELLAMVLYPSGSVDAEAVKTTLRSAFAIDTSTTKPVLVYDGHSGPEGYGSTFLNTVSRQAEAALSKPVTLYNTAVFGSSISEISGSFNGRVVPLFDASAPANIVIMADVSNSLMTDTAASSLTTLQSYCSAARSAGFKVIISTVKPRSDASANFLTEQPSFNSSLRSGWTSFADGLSDYAANATIGGTGAGTGITSNTTYWFDGVHLTSIGQGIAAGIDALVINGLIP